MKAFFGIYEKSEEDKAKKKLMKFSGIPKEYITYQDVPTVKNEYIHVYIIDDTTVKNKPVLVMTHGLFGSAILYYKILKAFSKYFKIVGYDLPGMGCSSRDDIEFKDVSDAEDFFLDRIDMCFKNLELSSFFVLGFSLGGYISSLYSLRFPEKVKALILLSPIGLSTQKIENSSVGSMWSFLRKFAFEIKRPPSLIFKIFGVFSNSVYSKSYGELDWIKDQKETEAFLRFNNCVFSNYITAEKVIFTFFNELVQAYKPIIYEYDIIKDKKIFILYGETDYNPSELGKDLEEINPDNIKVDIVTGSGHTLYGDNYEETKEKVLSFLDRNGFISRLS